MGIKGLVSYVKKKCPTSIRDIDLKQLKGMTLACDALHYLYRYKSVCTHMDSAYPKHYIDFFISLIKCLFSHKISVIFIFDGPPPDEKSGTRLKRRSSRDAIREKALKYKKLMMLLKEKNPDLKIVYKIYEELENKKCNSFLDLPPMAKLVAKYDKLMKQVVDISSNDIKNLKLLLKNLGIPYIKAEGEGEQLCAQLTINEIVNTCLTADSDVLAYGCPYYIKEINTLNNTCKVIEIEDVKEVLGFENNDQLLDFCIMCGTDYNENIKNIGPAKAHKLILEHGNIEGVEKHIGVDKCNVLNYKRVREIFRTNHSFISPERIDRTTTDKYAFLKHMRRINVRVSTDTMIDLGF